MRLIKPLLGDRLKTNNGLSFGEFLKLLGLLAVIAGIGYLGLITYRHFHNSAENELAKKGYSTPSQFEKASSSVSNQYLTSKDYGSYIDKQVLLASHYTAVNDNKDAERVMNEVFTNVPESQVNSFAYSEMANIEQALGNTDQYKKYLGLLIKRFQTEGNTEAAQSTQQILDGVK